MNRKAKRGANVNGDREWEESQVAEDRKLKRPFAASGSELWITGSLYCKAWGQPVPSNSSTRWGRGLFRLFTHSFVNSYIFPISKSNQVPQKSKYTTTKSIFAYVSKRTENYLSMLRAEFLWVKGRNKSSVWTDKGMYVNRGNLVSHLLRGWILRTAC
jgi:hypothetical protein